VCASLGTSHPCLHSLAIDRLTEAQAKGYELHEDVQKAMAAAAEGDGDGWSDEDEDCLRVEDVAVRMLAEVHILKKVNAKGITGPAFNTFFQK
jgi:hypothetical protein